MGGKIPRLLQEVLPICSGHLLYSLRKVALLLPGASKVGKI